MALNVFICNPPLPSQFLQHFYASFVITKRFYFFVAIFRLVGYIPAILWCFQKTEKEIRKSSKNKQKGKRTFPLLERNIHTNMLHFLLSFHLVQDSLVRASVATSYFVDILVVVNFDFYDVILFCNIYDIVKNNILLKK